MTDAVTRDAGAVTRDASAARAAHARRPRLGIVVRRIELQREWLDALEEPGYLDPFERGNRAHERKAIERFLAESLARPR